MAGGAGAVAYATAKEAAALVKAQKAGQLALTLVLTVLCAIRLEYNYRSMLVLQSRLGTEPGRWKPVYMDFVKVWLATLGVFLLGGGVLFAWTHELPLAAPGPASGPSPRVNL